MILIKHIQMATAEMFGITMADLVGSDRCRRNSGPRQMAMYLCSKMCGVSSAEVGKAFGGRDHTTALYAIKAVDGRLKSPAYVAEMDLLRGQIRTLAGMVQFQARHRNPPIFKSTRKEAA